MVKKCANFLHRHLYLAWGTVVVGGVSCFTGAVVASIVGYLIGVTALLLFDRLLS